MLCDQLSKPCLEASNWQETIDNPSWLLNYYQPGHQKPPTTTLSIGKRFLVVNLRLQMAKKKSARHGKTNTLIYSQGLSREFQLDDKITCIIISDENYRHKYWRYLNIVCWFLYLSKPILEPIFSRKKLFSEKNIYFQ